MSTLMESTMRDAHLIFIVSSPSLSAPPRLLGARWRPLGAEVAMARGQSRAWQGGEPLKDLLPCKEDLSLNIKACFYLTAVCRLPPTYLGFSFKCFFFFSSLPKIEFNLSVCASCPLDLLPHFPTSNQVAFMIPLELN